LDAQAEKRGESGSALSEKLENPIVHSQEKRKNRVVHCQENEKKTGFALSEKMGEN
jgi:hypothetical protein